MVYAPGDLVNEKNIFRKVLFISRDLRSPASLLRMKPYQSKSKPRIFLQRIIQRTHHSFQNKGLQNDSGGCLLFRGEQCHTHNLLQVPIAELAERWTELPQVSDESRSFFRVHTSYFSNIPKCIKAEFIASWACSQSSVVSSSKR
ncbi:hypothetical protein TNCV_2064191 [Trichonephila clavipes]|nr:hypothetical protein TNCV_2064191 [Trichonephila clavipes]